MVKTGLGVWSGRLLCFLLGVLPVGMREAVSGGVVLFGLGKFGLCIAIYSLILLYSLFFLPLYPVYYYDLPYSAQASVRAICPTHKVRSTPTV